MEAFELVTTMYAAEDHEKIKSFVRTGMATRLTKGGIGALWIRCALQILKRALSPM